MATALSGCRTVGWSKSERRPTPERCPKGRFIRNSQGRFSVMKKRRLFDETTQMNQSPRSMQLIRSLLALLIVVTTARGAEPESPPPRVMTLVDCIQAALQYNLGLQIPRSGPQLPRSD